MEEGKNRLTHKSYKEVFDRLYKPLCLFAYKYVNDLKDSEDIVQNVFIKVWEDKITFKNKNKVDGFFYTAVKNKSLDFLRSKYSKDVKAYSSEALEILQTEAYFISEATIIEASKIIENALKLLPNRCAETIRFSIEAYTNKEIADKMNISVHTVKEYKKSSYKTIRKFFCDLAIKQSF